MRWVQILLMCAISFQALADVCREHLLWAWKECHNNNPDIVEFKKLGNDSYPIKFAQLPLEGEVRLLTDKTAAIDYLSEISPYTHTGYVEIDLISNTSW
jgi:hypothetical protein